MMIFYSVRVCEGGVFSILNQASIKKTSPIKLAKNFYLPQSGEIMRVSNYSTPVVYVKAGLEQITSQRCAKGNEIPPPLS